MFGFTQSTSKSFVGNYVLYATCYFCDICLKEIAQIKCKIKKLDELNIGGNCKEQEKVLIYIEKTIRDKLINGGIVNYNSLKWHFVFI